MLELDNVELEFTEALAAVSEKLLSVKQEHVDYVLSLKKQSYYV